MDDIIVFGKDLEDHAKNLRKIISELTKSNFKLQPDKSEFLKSKVSFLGFTVSKEGIKLSEDKIIAIKNFQEPSNLKDLRSFLGLSR